MTGKLPVAVNHGWTRMNTDSERPYLTPALSLPLCGPERETGEQEQEHDYD